MDYILEVSGLTDHSLGMQRKAYVESVEIMPQVVMVKFYMRYFVDGKEWSSNSMQVNAQRFSTDEESYNTLIAIQADSSVTIYQTLLGLVDAQVRQIVSDGKTD